MFEEKIIGTDLIKITDKETENVNDCEMKYTVTVKGDVANSSLLQSSEESNSINNIINTTINNYFTMSRMIAFPNGIEFSDINDAKAAVSSVLTERITPILARYGLVVSQVSVDNMELSEDDNNKFNFFRDRKNGKTIKSDSNLMTDDGGMMQTSVNESFMKLMGEISSQIPLFKAQMTSQANGNILRETAQTDEWICVCGNKNKGKFCTMCGAPKKSS